MFTTPWASVCLGSRGQVEERPGKDKQPNKSSLFSIIVQSLGPGVREALNNDTSKLDLEVPILSKQIVSQRPAKAADIHDIHIENITGLEFTNFC